MSREPSLAEWAGQNGWLPIGDTRWMAHRWPRLVPERVPTARRSRPLIMGAYRLEHPRGRVITAAPVDGGGPHLVAVPRPAPGPMALIAPKSGWTAMVALGLAEVGTGFPPFDRHRGIYVADAADARAVADPRIVERLVRPDTEALSVLFHGEDVVVHVNRHPRPSWMPRMLDLAFDLRDILRG